MDSVVIQVSGDESALVSRADQIEKEAWERNRAEEAELSKAAGKPIAVPLLEYGTPQEAKIVFERDRLADQYKEMRGLSVRPLLIPAMPSSQASQTYEQHPMNYRGFSNPSYRNSAIVPYFRTADNTIIPESLMKKFLDRVPSFRVGERLYMWRGSCYRYVNDNTAKSTIKLVLRDDLNIPNSDVVIGKVLSLLKIEAAIQANVENASGLVAVRNGVVDLNTLTPILASPTYRNTHFLDVEWPSDTNCPVFSATLQFMSGGDQEWVKRILEVIGYLLTADYTVKRFVVFQGPGDCGKSVLGNLIASFFSDDDVAALADHQFGNRFSLSAIANAHFSVCMDLPDGVLESKAVSILKQITGGDRVAIEAKGKDIFSDHIRCKVLFGTNNPIRLKRKDEAFANRLLLVPFYYSVPEEQRDHSLLDKLMQERPAILYHALAAYREVVKRGYKFTGEDRFGFRVDDIEVENGPEAYILPFVNEVCVKAYGLSIPSELLMHHFNAYCGSFGVSGYRNTAAFSRAFNRVTNGEFESKKQRFGDKNVNCYLGIDVQSNTYYAS